MTNALANRPTYIEQSTTINSALGGGLVGSQPPRISLDGDRFTLFDETGEKHPTVAPSLTLDVVIVGANEHVSRIYYADYERGGDNSPPLCFSDNGKAPSEQSLQPQHVTCSGCPKAAWTKINALGNKVPWCQNRKKIAVLVAGAGETVYLLSVPPKSLSNSLQPYMKYLNDNNAPAQCVITRLKIEDKVLRFEEMGWVPEASMAFIRETVAGDLPANVVNAFDRPISTMPALAAPPASAVGLKAVAEAVQTVLPAQQFAPENPPPAKISFSMSSTPTPEGEKRGPGRPRAKQEINNAGANVPFTPMGSSASFGMVSDAPAPPAEIQAKLDNVFARFGPK